MTGTRRHQFPKGRLTARACAAGWMVILLALGGGGARLSAHDSPDHVVELLTRQIERHHSPPDLLLRRATEFRVLGQLKEAAADLELALKKSPELTSARAELSRVYLAQGKTNAALAAINLAMKESPGGEASFLMIRAEIYGARGEDASALADCAQAFQREPIELDWYLTRAQIQSRLGRHRLCADGLKEGFDKTGSGLLEAEWIEAQIDAGLYREAVQTIEPRLAESRCQSSWLLRRARAYLGLGREEAARQDLFAAIVEIGQRVNPLRPDVTLLADRGLAYALLGDAKSAQRELVAARQAGAEEWVVRRLTRQLSELDGPASSR